MHQAAASNEEPEVIKCIANPKIEALKCDPERSATEPNTVPAELTAEWEYAETGRLSDRTIRDVASENEIPPKDVPGYIGRKVDGSPAVTWDRPDEDLGDLKNDCGITLDDVRAVSYRLDYLLELLNPQNRYESVSEADMNTVYLLRGWRFDPDDCVQILRNYRDRRGRHPGKEEKMRRKDYAPRTVAAATGRVEPIDPPLAHALVHSARQNDGHGPLAGRETIDVVWGGLAAYGPENPVKTRRVAEKSGYNLRRTRRGLHILADAGYIGRRDAGDGYRWTFRDAELQPWISVRLPRNGQMTDGFSGSFALSVS